MPRSRTDVRGFADVKQRLEAGFNDFIDAMAGLVCAVFIVLT